MGAGLPRASAHPDPRNRKHGWTHSRSPSCHIAEHIESGMMLNFRVDDSATATLDSPGSRAEAH